MCSDGIVRDELRDRIDRDVVSDAGFVVLIAGLLMGLNAELPPGVRVQLAFDHEAFVPWTGAGC
jgi:hypothetical protein